MGKIRAKVEKRLRNETYAKRFLKEDEELKKKEKKSPKDATWAKWCRIEGHPANCECTYL